MRPATAVDLRDALDSLGIPVRYGYYGAGTAGVPPLPRITYRFKLSADTIYADDKPWQRYARYDIELEEKSKDFRLEKRICDALTAAGITWERYEYPQDGNGDDTHWLQVIWEVLVAEETTT